MGKRASLNKMRHNVDPFLVPAEDPGPDFVRLVGLNLSAEDDLHSAQDHDCGGWGRAE